MAWAWDGSNRKCCHDSRKSYTNPMGNAYTYVYVNIIKYMRSLVIILNVRIPICIQYTITVLVYLSLKSCSMAAPRAKGFRICI